MAEPPLTDEQVFGKPKAKTVFSDADVFGPRSDFADTATIAGAGALQGLREGMNPLNLLAGIAHMGNYIAKAGLGLAFDPKTVETATAPGTSAVKSLVEASPATDPMRAASAFLSPEMQKATEATLEKYGTPEAAYRTTGAEKTDLREGLAGAARFLGRMVPTAGLPGGLTGAALRTTGAGAVGAGAGRALGGPEGEAVGAALGLVPGTVLGALGVRSGPAIRASETPPPSTGTYLIRGASSLENFGDIPAAVTKQSFGKYATAVEDAVNPSRTVSNIFGEKLFPDKIYPISSPLMEEMRAWNKGQTIDGAPIHGGFTMGELKAFRDKINKGLEEAPYKSPDSFVLMKMKNALDNYIGGLKNGTDALHGNVEYAADVLKRGLKTYSIGKAASEYDRIAELAKLRDQSYSVPNMDRAVTTEFMKPLRNERSLARIEARAPGITDVIKNAAEGDPVRNVLANVGNFTPRHVFPGLVAAKQIAEGKWGWAIPTIIALLARAGASARARSSALAASEYIRRGGPPATAYEINPAYLTTLFNSLGMSPEEPQR